MPSAFRIDPWQTGEFGEAVDKIQIMYFGWSQNQLYTQAVYDLDASIREASMSNLVGSAIFDSELALNAEF